MCLLRAPGPKGEPGPDGAPGQDGQGKFEFMKFFDHKTSKTHFDIQAGPAGPPGGSGTQGEKGICPKYCALDGGVFFEDGTRR
ncbi:Col-cuticle-N domain-containing protein [Aphelenchoides bicaudatus]|nr:Col-cuticle-N domain-containing protein [Aphelenchoides bicaudatus]